MTKLLDPKALRALWDTGLARDVDQLGSRLSDEDVDELARNGSPPALVIQEMRRRERAEQEGEAR